MSARMDSMDALRGFAVLGIFLVNILCFALPYGVDQNPLMLGGNDHWNTLAWGINKLLVEGSMFALFALLFGASAMILLREEALQGPDALTRVDRYYRRNLWLILFGLIHAFVLLWPLEILFTYGVLGLFLFPLRRLRPVLLFGIGLAMVITGYFSLLPQPGEPQEEGADLQPASLSVPAASSPATAPATPYQLSEDELAQISADIELFRSGYANLFLQNIEVAVGQQTSNLYHDNLFDAGGMMLIGMALFRWGLLSGGRSLLFYALVMLGGYGLALFLRYPAVAASISSHFDPEQVLFTMGAPFFLGRLPLAFGHIGLILLLIHLPLLALLRRLLAATGRMALSHYVGQTLFAIVLFYGFGFAQFGRFEYHQLLLIAISFGVLQMVSSLLWLKRCRQGPLEWLWRSLVEGRPQPFLHHRPAPPNSPLTLGKTALD